MVGISMVAISIISSVANGTIASNMSMTIVNASNNTYIMGMSSSISVMDWETMMNLTKGVSIGLRIGITLSIITMMSISMVPISIISSVSNSTISGNTSISIVYTSDYTNIMRMSSSISIMDREAMMNLSKSVGIRV